MKRLLAILAVLCVLSPVLGKAESMLFPTYAEGPGYRDALTLDAFLPLDSLKTEAAMPEDFCIDREKGITYLADTGQGRVLQMGRDGELLGVIGEGTLQTPGGVAFREGVLYVADSGKRQVFLFDEAGGLLLSISRPDHPAFGRSTGFVPRKVSADARGNIYVVSDNTPNGVLQFNREGQFSGFIGANTAQLGWVTILQRLLYTDKQKAQLLQVLPPSPTNAFINQEGLLLTVTNGIEPGVRKFSTSGNLLLEPDFPGRAMLDVAADAHGSLFGIDALGGVHIVDSLGDRVFSFTTRSEHLEVRGATKNPIAIDVDAKGDIYLLDRENASIIRFAPTEFGALVMRAVKDYSEGLYLQSEPLWRGIESKNSTFLLVNRALAQAHFKQGRYEEALKQFRLGEDRRGYSEAFWYIRNDWLQNNLGKALVIAAAAFIVLKLLLKLLKSKGLFRKDSVQNEPKFLQELRFAGHYLRHPVDGTYEIKFNRKGDVFGATVICLCCLIAIVIRKEGTAYLFRGYEAQAPNLLVVLLAALLPFALGIVASYLVSAINDGEASLRQVYVVAGYSLAPYAIITPLLTLLSHVLTRNEAFIYQFINLIAILWTAALMLIGLKEAYAYKVGGLVKNLLLTGFTMVSAVVVFAVVVMLATQEGAFLQTLWNEVMMRVKL